MVRRLVRAAALVVLLLALVHGALAGDADRPRLPVGALDGDLRVDGALDEPAGAAAQAASDLLMVEPRQSAVPTAPTVVKVLAGPKALVFGIRCQDLEPSRIAALGLGA